MHYASKIVQIGVVASILTACSGTTFAPIQTNTPTGAFTTTAPLKDDEIKVFTPFEALQSVPFIYVRAYSQYKQPEFESFLRSSLHAIGFKNVVVGFELENFVREAGLASGDIADGAYLHELYKTLGRFLAAQFVMVQTGELTVEFRGVIVDPAGGKVLFDAYRKKVNWDGIDNQFALPMMDAIDRWVKASGTLP